MTIKLIAVDMDGTFLNKEMGYDKERFLKQYAKMKEQGIRFVVASGNQYYQLKSFSERSRMKSVMWLKMALISSIRDRKCPQWIFPRRI